MSERKEEQVIDISSTSPALLADSKTSSTPSKLHTLSTKSLLNSPKRCQSHRIPTEEEDSDEHTYPHGLHNIPIHSPFQTTENSDDIILEQRQSTNGNSAHLFHSASKPFRFTNKKLLQRVIFRKRVHKDSEIYFWRGILLCTICSLAFLTFLLLYLTQSDFFASHQDDLFGATVDNRFTVIAASNAQAKVLLKSGYSNSRYSEAMMAFGNGILKIGRRKMSLSDTQRFYGLALHSNGSAMFTNKVFAPSIASDYVNVQKGLIFEDGTSMSTAANMSGGIKKLGDLNLVSEKGMVSVSAGNAQRMVVQSDGAVVFPKPEVEDPYKSGIAVESERMLVRWGDTLTIGIDETRAQMETELPLHLSSSSLWLGSGNDSKVVITPIALSSSRVDPMALEMKGQTGEIGGHVFVGGGDGEKSGGSLSLIGGKSTQIDKFKYEMVSINGNLDSGAASETVIGSVGSGHFVSLFGNVSIHAKLEFGSFQVFGNQTAVLSREIRLGSKRDVHDTFEGALQVYVGEFGTTELHMNAETAVLNAKNEITIGASAKALEVGPPSANIKISGEDMSFKAKALYFNRELPDGSINFFGASVFRSALNKTQLPIMEITEDAVFFGAHGDISIPSHAIHLGDPQTFSVTIHGEDVYVNSTRVALGSSNSTERLTVKASKSIDIGNDGVLLNIGTDASELAMKATKMDVQLSESIHIQVGTLEIKLEPSKAVMNAEHFILSSEMTQLGEIGKTEKVEIVGKQLELGIAATNISIGSEAEADISIGSNGAKVRITGDIILNGLPFSPSNRNLAIESLPSPRSFYVLEISNPIAVSISNELDRYNEFPLEFPVHFGSKDMNSAVRMRTDKSGFDWSLDPTISVRMDLHLVLVNVRLHSDTFMDKARFRCRVYQVSPNDPKSKTIALEATIAVDLCTQTATFSSQPCSDDFYSGLETRRIVTIRTDHSLSVQCSSTLVTAFQELLIDFAQLILEPLDRI